MKTAKNYTIVKNYYSRNYPTQVSEIAGTLEELIKYFSYTFMRGQSYEQEKGNRKINAKPASIKSLITNLNKSEKNASRNGSVSNFYGLKGETV